MASKCRCNRNRYKNWTPSAKLVKNGSTVTYVAGNNLTVAQDVDTNGNHKYTYSLNKKSKRLRFSNN